MKAVNVGITYNCKSRKELLLWINKAVRKPIERIEELCTGTVYCCLLDLLYPGSICLAHVKINPIHEYDRIYNFRLILNALHNLGVDKYLDLDKIVRGKFQDNFLFCQWFNKFWTVNCNWKKALQQRSKSFTSASANKYSKNVSRSKTMPVRSTTDLSSNEKQNDETKINVSKEFMKKATIQESLADSAEDILAQMNGDLENYGIDVEAAITEDTKRNLEIKIYRSIISHLELLLEPLLQNNDVLRTAFHILNSLNLFSEEYSDENNE